MKFIRTCAFSIVIFLQILACKKSPIDVIPVVEPVKETPKDTTVVVIPPKYLKENTWIYAQMKQNYLWESDMLVEEKTDKNLEPKAYFESLLSPNKDWVSYMKIQKEDMLDFWNGNLKSYGIRYAIIKKEDGTNNLNLAISLVLKDSPAEKAGMWRGDIITKINSSKITATNLAQLLESDQAEFEWTNTNQDNFKETIIKKKFQVNPFQTTEVFEIGSKKIGYLTYAQFLPNVENELRKIFGDFKNQNVNEFILDLRFNPGGFTPNTEIMGSLLVKNLNPGTEMYHNVWNKSITEEKIKTSGLDAGVRTWTSEVNNLDKLQRLYVLTSKTTSSSSELIINCLRPFMDVIIVGNNTYGKNVISVILTDETNSLPYGLMPAYTTILNVKGESNYGTKDGFTPDYSVIDDIMPYYPLGNPNETLLKKTLELITGIPPINTIDSLHYKVNLKDNYHYYDSGATHTF
ncbi:hypothetical protein EGI22_16340 [Lacihabitans sp. LS3-19]|uniref:S41 family peptidase n=1 Tax=Lacihabitans sp. LS3-19 TaxID=2487335 RepID=UPI0020CDBAAF|nr:S41 family peptidase [Lacihabitans sp. LS3-19]MCP9769474.1 hypothetical protein [Lacihabitans sp. LS3-19]